MIIKGKDLVEKTYSARTFGERVESALRMLKFNNGEHPKAGRSLGICAQAQPLSRGLARFSFKDEFDERGSRSRNDRALQNYYLIVRGLTD